MRARETKGNGVLAEEGALTARRQEAEVPSGTCEDGEVRSSQRGGLAGRKRQAGYGDFTVG